MLTTSSVLLQELLDPSREGGWREFDARYRPVLLAFARRCGLAEADADDVAQETLVRLVADLRAGRYDPARGRLRAWIFGICRTRVADLLRTRGRRREERGESALQEQGQENEDLDGVFEAEWRAAMLREALRALREETRTEPKNVRVLELLLLEGRDVAATAAALGLTPAAVYLAKHRILRRLRVLMEQFEKDW
ncbi:MAG: sigma-70 family RNA polymerase sigma factor [Planctomycetota bacterium]